MLSFLMNADNFGSYLGGGTGDGARAAGSGVELGLAEYSGDGQTLALWHLHEQTWNDASGHGRTLTPSGAVLTADGAGLAVADNACAFNEATNFQGLGEVTVEAWVAFASLPEVSDSYAILSQDTNLRFSLANFGVFYLQLVSLQAGSVSKAAKFYFDGEPEIGRWYHVVGTWKRGGALKVYVDGVAGSLTGALANADFASSNATMWIGPMPEHFFDGQIDEVRLSSVVRYTTNFTPRRRAASGTFASPALDAGRTGAQWLSLEMQSQIPATSSLALSARAADSLDGGGQVVGPWLALGATWPRGRYLQWRAALGRTTDPANPETPTLESVTAVASEAGYNLYHGVGEAASAIDYEAPLARLGPGLVSCQEAGLAAPAVHWFGVRSLNTWGSESKTVDAEVRLELDAQGARIPPRPASVESLTAAGVGGGGVQLQWLALAEMGEAPPREFRIYSNGGNGAVNFAAPLGSVDYQSGQRVYQWTSAAMSQGLTVRFVVRAETAAGGVDASPAQVDVLIDALSPMAGGHLSAATVLA
jgi:hypothetical protein